MACGTASPAPFVTFDPATRSWRTSPPCTPGGDDDILRLSGPLFDDIYEHCRQCLLLGREPS